MVSIVTHYCYLSYLWDTVVARVLQCEDDKHQQCTCDELREELACLCKKWLRVGAEYCCCSLLGRRHCSHLSTLKPVDGADVVCVYDTGSNETTQHLRSEVHREPPPWQLAVYAVAEGNGWVEIRPRVACHVQSKHDAQAPATCC
jgi:hypothetical protein